MGGVGGVGGVGGWDVREREIYIDESLGCMAVV